MNKVLKTYKKAARTTNSIWYWIQLAFKGDDNDFTSIRLSKAIFILSVPMVLEMCLNSIFSLVDMFFVSRLGGDAIATIGLTEAVVNLVYALSFGISIAATAVISRRIGERKYKAASEAALQSIILGLAVSVTIAIPGVIFSKDILRLMGASTQMVNDMSSYMSITLGGNASIILIFINNAIFRSSGKPLIALKTLAVANLINIILDPILIFGLGPIKPMGIQGAALATLIGRGTAVIYQFYLLYDNNQKLKLKSARKLLDIKLIGSISRLSLGGISQNLSATMSWLLLVRIISSFGSVAVAGYTIALRIVLFLLLPVAGIGNATATLVGQNLGAAKPERARRTVKITGITNVLIMLIFGIFVFVFAEWSVSLFSGEQNIIDAAKISLRMIALGFPIYGLGMVMVNALNGAGDTRSPFWINLICFLFIEVALALVLSKPAGLNETGVYIAILAAETLFTFFTLLVFSRGRWEKIKI